MDDLSEIRRQYSKKQWNELFPHFKEEYEKKREFFNRAITYETNLPRGTLNTDSMDRALLGSVRRQLMEATDIKTLYDVVNGFKMNSASLGLEPERLAALEDLIRESAKTREAQVNKAVNNQISFNIPG